MGERSCNFVPSGNAMTWSTIWDTVWEVIGLPQL